MSELEDQVTKVVAHKLTESCWIGAYKTTRQWEDTMWAELRPDVDVQEDSCDDSSLEGAMEGDVPEHAWAACLLLVWMFRDMFIDLSFYNFYCFLSASRPADWPRARAHP